MPTPLENFVQQQQWLQPVEAGLGRVADMAVGWPGATGQALRDFLHGTWLGHPLHSVLTDIPIGAWTASVGLDAVGAATGDDRFDPGADATLAIGMLGAGAAAVAGLTDWRQTDGVARRMGAVHGMLNTAAAGFFLGSMLLRRRDQRPAARMLSLMGYGIAMASGYLGGKLVYSEKIGVDHSPQHELSGRFQALMAADQLAEGQMTRAEFDGRPILLVRHGGQIYALAETCSHLGGPLSEGSLEGSSVRCPWHGSRFCLKTGKVLEGPSTHPQPWLETRVVGGQIEVRMPDAASAVEEQPAIASASHQ